MSSSERPNMSFQVLGRTLPFIGREGALETLEADFRACLGGQARLTLLTGAAGEGKSRLRHEFCHRIAVSHPEAEVWMGRANPLRQGSPFGVLAPAIRNGLGLLEGEPLDSLRQSLHTRLGLLFSEEEERQRIAIFLGEMAGVPFPDEDSLLLRAARHEPLLMVHQMRQAFASWLAAEAQLRPLLLVMEDAHWADPPTFAFLEFALMEVGAPWMALVIGREETEAVFPGLWQRPGVAVRRLDVLPEEVLQAHARVALEGRGDDATVTRLTRAASGNFRQLEELVRFTVDGRPLPTEIPGAHGLAAALARARFESLRVEHRRTLSAASLFGRSFRSGGVWAVLSPSPKADVRRWLEQLHDAELVTRRNEGLPGEEEWGFRNDDLREVALASLPAEERAMCHQLAGEWLLARGERDALALAENFERSQTTDEAVSAFFQASRQALNAGDARGAVARAERGILLAPRSAARGALRLIQAEAHRHLGESDLAGKRATEAISVLPQGTQGWFRALEEAINAMGRHGSYQRVSAWSRQAMSARPEPDAVSSQVICLCAGLRHLYQAGSHAFAEDVLHRVEVLAGDVDSLEPLAAAQLHRVMAARARHQGDLSGDLLGYQAAMRAFERAGDVHSACNAKVSVGFAYLELGEIDTGEMELREALTQAERLRVDEVATRARQNLALARFQQNRLSEARGLAARVIQESLVQANPRFAAWTRIYLSQIAAKQEDFVVAEAEGRAAAMYFSAAPPARAGALAAQARGLVGLGRAEEAREAMIEAMRVFQTMRGIEEFESHVRLMNAEVQAALGNVAQAREEIETARARLLERADDILDPGFRKSFLEKVPENARTLALAEAWS